MKDSAEVQSPRNTWRNHWFVKNVLGEIPILGAFFKHQSADGIFNHAAKSAFKLMGGTLFMYFNVMNVNKSDPAGITFGKMSATMAAGMMSGTVLYNTLFTVGKKTVACYQQSKAERDDGEYEEKQPLKTGASAYGTSSGSSSGK